MLLGRYEIDRCVVRLGSGRLAWYDLRQAVFTAPETVIYANAIWAGIDVIVNAHTNVTVKRRPMPGEERRKRLPR